MCALHSDWVLLLRDIREHQESEVHQEPEVLSLSSLFVALSF